MSAGMTKVRVKPGNVLAHGGKVYKGGEEVEVPTHILHEVKWQVESVDAEGNARPVVGVHIPGMGQPHERLPQLRQRLQEQQAAVEATQSAIDEEERLMAEGKVNESGPVLTPEEEAQAAVNEEQTKNLGGGKNQGQRPAGRPSNPAAALTDTTSANPEKHKPGTMREATAIDPEAKGGKGQDEKQ